MWILALWACDIVDLPPERNCSERTVYYPDEDGDGVGDRDRVYVGCEQPEGWVTEPPPADSDTGE